MPRKFVEPFRLNVQVADIKKTPEEYFSRVCLMSVIAAILIAVGLYFLDVNPLISFIVVFFIYIPK